MTDTKTTIVHCKKEKFEIYIGRPSFYGNIWTHIPEETLADFVVKTRAEAIDNYRKWLFGEEFHDVMKKQREHILSHLEEIRGKKLGCFCKGKYKDCHGDVLLELLGEKERPSKEQERKVGKLF